MGVCVFIISEIVSIIKIVKISFATIVGTIFGVLSFGAVIGFSVLFFTVSISLFLGSTSLFDYLYLRFAPDLSDSDLFQVVGYALNFDFVKGVSLFLYYTVTVFTSVYIGFFVSTIALAALPWIVSQFRSIVNFITGD